MSEKILVSLSREELLSNARESVLFYGIALERVSTVFLMQILQLQIKRVVNVHSILDEVKSLEGLSLRKFTKKAEMFKHAPLRGLYKKHFYDAHFLLMNTKSQFSLDFGGNKHLDEMINDAFSHNCNIGEVTNLLSQDFTISTYEKRAAQGKVTGEWIVFQPFNGKNYYLTIAAHNEGDDLIYERVKICYEMDFNFLNLNV